MEKILDRFLRYIAIDTMSDEESSSSPSAAKELVLSEMLFKELKALGLEAELDSNGIVTASIPSNCGKDAPVLGFIAHVDTAPDAPGKCVNPQIVRNYDGGDIALKGVPGLVLKVEDFPEMAQYKGQTIITTDGTTLLGADDKAGMAEIMAATEYIVNHPEFKHGTVRIAFTPDEEIGRGVENFDVTKFGADYAYTMDGGGLGEFEYENFNAASAKIHIQGRNIHPGYGKNAMLNALHLGMELNAMLPADQRPEHTCDHEGFFHLTAFNGTVEEADMSYIIRDHDMAMFEKKKKLMQDAVAFINSKYNGAVTLKMKDQYFNMKEYIVPHFHVVEKAVKAMEMAGIKPKVQPIRGGTDGAMLSAKGLPCPNIFAGGLNFHGKMEYVPLESMEKACEVILNIIKLYCE